MLHYSVTPLPHRHQWQIVMTFRQENAAGHTLKLANWVPGSYMVRDFSRHIMHIQASCNGTAAQLLQTAKNSWQTPPQSGDYRIEYTVYANDLSVRASLLDNERGFIDPACLFLYIEGRTEETHSLEFQKLPENWQIHTTLPQTASRTFQTASYAQFIDHPLEFGADLETLHFTACGIPHRIVLSGTYPDFDRQRLADDCRKICETELTLFPKPAPFNEYLFLLHLGDNIYGGLEHISSTALHADRNALPAHGMQEADPEYIQLLGLISHEYFHAWNVKSIKPAAFAPYRLDSETYTEQLWAFEGITSYYDDLILVRSGVISTENYLRLLAENLTRVRRQQGRHLQTLAQSSFAAWHKYYKQDENSPNAIVSYYQQGALAALCLDLLIRQRSGGSKSLDTVMQQLYADWTATGQGIAEQDWQRQAQTITGLDLNDFFQAALYTTDELPLQSSLKTAGINLTWLPENQQSKGRYADSPPKTMSAQAELGGRCKQNADHAVLTHVYNNSSLEQAGLKPGDTIIAVNGFACRNLLQQAQTRAGDIHTLHYFRHGILKHTELTVQNAAADTACLNITDTGLLNQWLFNKPAA